MDALEMSPQVGLARAKRQSERDIDSGRARLFEIISYVGDARAVIGARFGQLGHGLPSFGWGAAATPARLRDQGGKRKSGIDAAWCGRTSLARALGPCRLRFREERGVPLGFPSWPRLRPGNCIKDGSRLANTACMLGARHPA